VAIFWTGKAESDRQNFYDTMEVHSKDRADEIDLAIANTVTKLSTGELPGMRVDGSKKTYRFVMSTGHYILYDDNGVDIEILRIRR